ncbi:hypothetical protein EV426DRAFT_416865 [Tirmania nivea]|nr:hypothetical protein EV426DRAFT_416865 [Tirmania nivea]
MRWGISFLLCAGLRVARDNALMEPFISQDSRRTSRPGLPCIHPPRLLPSSATSSAHPSLPSSPISGQSLPHADRPGLRACLSQRAFRMFGM